LHAVSTHRAFLHFWKELAPFILGDTERTSDHAVAAPHAATFFVDHGAFRSLAQSGHRTNGSAGGLGTIHAKAPHIFLALGKDDRVFVLRLARFSGDRVVVWKFVFVSARLLTLLAIDAERSVVQQSLAHRDVSWRLRCRAERTGGEEGGGARWAAAE
jgi:hypothetical protein